MKVTRARNDRRQQRDKARCRPSAFITQRSSLSPSHFLRFPLPRLPKPPQQMHRVDRPTWDPLGSRFVQIYSSILLGRLPKFTPINCPCKERC